MKDALLDLKVEMRVERQEAGTLSRVGAGAGGLGAWRRGLRALSWASQQRVVHGGGRPPGAELELK